MKNYFFAAIVFALTACSQQAIPAVQTQQLAQVTQHLADLAPIIVAAPVAQPAPVQPPVTFGGPDPLKCPVVLSSEAGRQVARLEAGNANCPPQDSGRAPIWLTFSKDSRLVISYGLWVDNGSQASAEAGVTISREDGGLIR